MQQCWALDPEDRPTFTSLVMDLSHSLSMMANYLTLSQDLVVPVANGNDGSGRSSPRYVQDPTEPQNESLDYGYIDLRQENMHSRTGSRNENESEDVHVVVNVAS